MDARRTALLVMDVQAGIVERLGSSDLLERLAAACQAARAAAVQVVYVKVGFRAGYPEVSVRNRAFSRISGSGAFTGGPDGEIHAAVAPEPGDVIVTKRRVSAFAGSDLDVVLRFQLTVLADACADADDEVHRVLTEKVFPRQAEVVGVSDWISSLARKPALN